MNRADRMLPAIVADVGLWRRVIEQAKLDRH
jgi:hypothetical protein